MQRWLAEIPPRQPISEELRYVLLRAFSPAPAPRAGAPDEVLRLARALDLGARIAARVPLDVLAAELGRASAVTLFQQQALRRAQADARAGHARRVLALAREARTPLALLKGAALERLGLVAPGARRAGDLDLLVPRASARALQQALLCAGWRSAGLSAHAHQLEPLLDPDGLMLELHVGVPGLRAPGTRSDAGFESLAQAGLLVPDERLEGAYLPTLACCRAHALVHGLWQHALQPQAYPAARLLADAQDLGLGAAEPGGFAREWVEPRVPAPAFAALKRLLARLELGESELLGDAARRPPERLLLDHVLAGTFAPAYQQALRRRQRLHDLLSPRLVWKALFPSAEQLERLHGPLPPLARLGRRLWRPFALLPGLLPRRRPAAR